MKHAALPEYRHKSGRNLTMQRRRELGILQCNVQKSKDVVLASLFSDSRVLEYDILAIQEQ